MTDAKDTITITAAVGGISYSGTEDPWVLIVFGVVALAAITVDYLKYRLDKKSAKEPQ